MFFPKPCSYIAVAHAMCLLFRLSLAQNSAACNPLKEKCPDDAGLAVSEYAVDFTKSKSTPENWTVANYETVTYGTNGAEFTFNKRHDAPSLWTDFKILFGRVEVVVQGAPGLGIISSMVLLSDDLDEIDWEMKGTGGNAIGTNYWGKGILDYTKNAYVGVSAPNSAFHNYVLDWSSSKLVWEIDSVVVRTVTAAQAGNKYPQSPMKLCFSVWDGGDPSNPEGTIQWAGGVTPLPPSKPYSMYVKSAKITNFNPGAEYEYTDKSGNVSSIKVIKDSLGTQSSSASAATLKQSTSKADTSQTSDLSIKAEGSMTTPQHAISSIFSESKSTSSMNKTSESSRLFRSSPLPVGSTKFELTNKPELSSFTPSHQSTFPTHSVSSMTTSRSANPEKTNSYGSFSRNSSSSASMKLEPSTSSHGNSTTKMIYANPMTFSKISVGVPSGETGHQLLSITSTVYSTSVATMCSKCVSNTAESASTESATHFSSTTHRDSPPEYSPLTYKTKSSALQPSRSSAGPSVHHSSGMTQAPASSAAPPMAPVLLAAMKTASHVSSKTTSSGSTVLTMKTTVKETGRSGITTSTVHLTSTSTRTHGLLLWSTNGTNAIAASTSNLTGGMSSTNGASISSMTNALTFTSGTFGIKPWVPWSVGCLVILGALL